MTPWCNIQWGYSMLEDTWTYTIAIPVHVEVACYTSMHGRMDVHFHVHVYTVHYTCTLLICEYNMAIVRTCGRTRGVYSRLVLQYCNRYRYTPWHCAYIVLIPVAVFHGIAIPTEYRYWSQYRYTYTCTQSTRVGTRVPAGVR